MEEKLVRNELLIQSIKEKGYNVISTVPIHLAIMKLPPEGRTNFSLIEEAREVVEPWYNKDITNHIKILREEKIEFLWFDDYGKYQENWELTAKPDDNGFLSLLWKEYGRIHTIKYNSIPVVLSNQHDENGKFYTPKSITKDSKLIEIIYRDLNDSEILVMSPDKLRKYGRETKIAKIDEDKGIAEVLGNVFTSDYHDNMAKTLLLRNYTVFYLNKLFDKTNKGFN